VSATTISNALGSTSAQSAAEWIPEPYLHIGLDRVYNPLTDRTFLENEAFYGEFRSVLTKQRDAEDLDEPVAVQLRADGWLVKANDEDLDRRFLLKYVSIETHTVCNQKCYFCP